MSPKLKHDNSSDNYDNAKRMKYNNYRRTSYRRRKPSYRSRRQYTNNTQVRPGVFNALARANAREWKADFTLKGIVNDNVQMINPATKSNDCRAYAFYASRIVEHSRSYMNLYDQYRIKMVTIEIDVWSNGKKGMLLLKTDVDDNDAIDYDKLILDPKTCKYNMDLDGKTVLWRCYPKAQVNIYQTSSSKDAHGPANRFQWIDCSNSDVQY